ncbi:MAG: glycosyltransferase family 39 protein [Flavobacteriales bacterium]|nr:glycosyltransferase family 39 protein [Flavobacteriales bacterium]
MLKRSLPIWILWIAAAVVRLIHLGDFSFINDELSAITRADFNDLNSLFTHGILTDVHPAGVQVFIYYWLHAFGYDEWIVRLPFAIAGTLAVVFFSLIARRFLSEHTAFAVTALLAFLAFPVQYSQYARPYAIGLMFVMMLAWFWCRIVLLGERKWHVYALMMIAAAGCLYSHYFAGLSAAIAGASGLLFLRKRALVYYCIPWVLAALVFLPHLSLTFLHLHIGGIGGEEGWLGPPQPSFFKDFLWDVMNQSWMLIIITLAFVIAFFRVGHDKDLKRFRMALLLWAFVPAAFGYLYSIQVNPILQPRALLFSFPFFLLLMFSFAGDRFVWYVKPVALTFSVLVLCSTMLGFSIYDYQKTQGEFKGVARQIKEIVDETGTDQTLVLANVHHVKYLQFYLNQWDVFPEMYNSHDLDIGQLDSLMQVTDKKMVLNTWVMGWQPIEINTTVRNYFPYRQKATYFLGAGVELYSQEAGDRSESEWLLDTRLDFGTGLTDNPGWNYPQDHVVDSLLGKAGPMYRFADGEEFGITYEMPMDPLQPGDQIYVNADVWMPPPNGDAHLTISLWKKDGTNADTYILGKQVRQFRSDPIGWIHPFVTMTIPPGWHTSDILKVYIWNAGKTELRVDQMTIRGDRNTPLPNSGN